MATPVVVVQSGGLPVVEADNGLPISIAANGLGLPVTFVSNFGQPATVVPVMLFMGEFTAATEDTFTGFNRGKWVEEHDWDSGSDYGTYADENAILAIVDSTDFWVVLQGAANFFEDGIVVTIDGGHPISLDHVESGGGDAWYDDCYVYRATAHDAGLTDGGTYSFTIAG
jgi:hypothetical protein